MSEAIHPVPEAWAKNALINADRYAELYRQSVEDPDGFWRQEAQRLDWLTPFTRVQRTSFDEADFGIRWFEDGALNIAANCLDRHLAVRGDAIAILWESDDPSEPERRISYRQLHAEVCRFANLLKARGVGRGDRVTLYLPMVPEAAVAMLACARIGAIHSIVFAGFSPDALAGRILDCGSRLVVTADEGLRGGRRVPLKANVDEALTHCRDVDSVIVLRRTGAEVAMQAGRDVDWHDSVAGQSAECPTEAMNAEDPLFILYTSGSTGKPKGVLHTNGGYAVWASMTHQYVFDYRPGQIFWCAADIGWVTGHSYVVYGPLINGATTVMFEGVPNWPDPSRFWQVVDKFGVEIFYGAPTALRALMREGDHWVQKTRRLSLRLLGSVGEPINPEAWEWYHRVVGEGRCPIVDTWWQTETGAAMITPLPGATDLKPGSASKPMFGVAPQLVDSEGKVLDGATEGCLVITQSWPGQMRGVWGDPERFFQTYFTTFPGKYFTGDGCRRDADGYYWITGRIDDVINVSGHRMGTAEIESALVAHEAVAEAAVVGMPHAIKGQGIYAYVTTNADVEPDEALRRALVQWVRHEIGPIATPDVIQFAPGLPKTRSGKIMRRILRKIAENETSNLGDISTLADPSVVATLVADRPQLAEA
ncbi:acetate--CoA ligase [Sphingomonas sp. ABOLE]|uniref:acetate--CoA ligase n=1 Tax=Sphingomonas sp. ABOLE TaxID=1985878 RepID=UPI000F7E168A|nr:acetate--CoA ligase [Sphingomonas sp. ABOLE]RSV34642.1 acetate--CoA ligase [Sphingomonas sp. ABOLE]